MTRVEWCTKAKMGHNIDNRTMEIITDELKRNDVHINITILSQYIKYILDNNGDLYNGAVDRLNSQEIQNVFNEMNVINLGRALTYLTLVYYMDIPEDSVREAVRLVAPFLKTVGDATILTFLVNGGPVERVGGGDGYAVYIARWDF